MTSITDAAKTWRVDTPTSNQNSLLTTTVGKKGTGDKTLGQSDYLKLMTAQLQFQDPFEPMDNTQMVAQMAQFSQIAASAEGNKTLTSIADALSGSRLSDAASWIGKSMLVKSVTAAPDGAGQYAGQIALAADSEAVTVELVDSAGATVKSIDLGKRKAGDVDFYWSGKDAAGAQAATGPLTIRVKGATASRTAAWATIAAVQSPASGASAKLITTLGNFTASDALSLS